MNDEDAMAELWERFWDDDWIDDDMTKYWPEKEENAVVELPCSGGKTSGGVDE